MNPTTITFVSPAAVATPRGAVLVGEVFTRLRAVWRMLAQALAAPSAAAPVRSLRAREAANVREMARLYATTDPGFAADLCAAAARHESLDDPAEDTDRRTPARHR